MSEECGYEVIARFPAMYSGFCAVDHTHKIKRGEMVGRIQRADNPMLVVTGVACYRCLKLLPSL